MADYSEDDIKLIIRSIAWVMAESDRLLNEYRKCRTENCKGRVTQKLKTILAKMNYEKNVLDKIIQKGKDEGLEL